MKNLQHYLDTFNDEAKAVIAFMDANRGPLRRLEETQSNSFNSEGRGLMFKVNQKVVCVDATNCNLLKQDAIYTVTALKSRLGFTDMIEIDCQPSAGGCCGYLKTRFRPLVSRKTDVSFTTGADPESEKWDNRKPIPVYTFDTTEHESIMQYLRGFY